jgi:HK97 gp10 family phage protein
MATKEFNNWSKVADALPKATKEAVKKTSSDAKANIQANIRSNGQVDTGFMVGSVYTVTSDGSDYQGGADALPPVATSTSDNEAYVAVAANYGVYQELGTVHMPGRPFFEPGIERTKASLDAAMTSIKTRMEEAAG